MPMPKLSIVMPVWNEAAGIAAVCIEDNVFPKVAPVNKFEEIKKKTN